MFSRVITSALTLLTISISAQAQVQKLGTIDESIEKATVSINRAMNTPSEKAEVIFDTILDVTPSGRVLLKAANRALEVSASFSNADKRAILFKIQNNRGKEFAFEISEGSLKSVRPLSKNEAKDRQAMRLHVQRARGVNRVKESTPRVPFAPTIVSNTQQANGIFFAVDLMNQKYMDLNDNCFNRSHYFARQNEIGASAQFDQVARKTSGALIPASANPLAKPIFSEKIFVLFTDRYMKAFNHKWWYHTSPTVRVVQGGGQAVFVLDRSYMDQAVPREAWLQAFAGHAYKAGKLSDGTFWDGSGCKPLKTLKDYNDGTLKEMCYYSEGQNMYTYLPTDLQTPNSKVDWNCMDFYNLIQGIPYPDPRRISLGTDYNTYVRSGDNQVAWMQYNGGNFMPQDCRPQ